MSHVFFFAFGYKKVPNSLDCGLIARSEFKEKPCKFSYNPNMVVQFPIYNFQL